MLLLLKTRFVNVCFTLLGIDISVVAIGIYLTVGNGQDSSVFAFLI